MKIIDILRIIANNKKPPMEIEYDGTKWKYIEDEKDYSSEERNEWLFDECIITEILNDYVGILDNIENNKQDKIGKCDIDWNTTLPLPAKDENEAFIMTGIQYLGVKINEIIDRFNKE